MTKEDMALVIMREVQRAVRLAHAHGYAITVQPNTSGEPLVSLKPTPLREIPLDKPGKPWQALHALDPRIHISGDHLRFQSPVMHITGDIAESVTVQVEPGISRNLLVQRDM